VAVFHCSYIFSRRAGSLRNEVLNLIILSKSAMAHLRRRKRVTEEWSKTMLLLSRILIFPPLSLPHSPM
jgi:hypothetical protein